jgi:hypothetical protein
VAHSGSPANRAVTPSFVVPPEAEADVEDAHDWYEGRSPGLGTRFLDAVEATISFVKAAPERFPSSTASRISSFGARWFRLNAVATAFELR